MSLRRILLTRIGKLNYKLIKADNNTLGWPWLALGHFDVIYTQIIDFNDDLKTLYKNNMDLAQHNDGDVYIHPLYLYTSDDSKDNSLALESKWFMGIIRIHYVDGVEIRKTRIHLSDYLFHEAKSAGIQICVYQSIEMSDSVVVIAGNQLCKLLTFSLTLRKHACIGKVYSYYAINFDLLCNDGLPEGKDVIDYLSMRMAVSDMEHIEQQITLFQSFLGKEATYSIAGIDDLMITCKKTDIKVLIKLFRKVLLDSANDLSSSVYSLTTRLGIDYQQSRFDQIKQIGPKSTALERKCQDILALCEDIKNAAKSSSEEIQTLLYSVIELTNSLTRMRNIVVFHELVYMMLPAADTFLRNIISRIPDRGASQGRTLEVELYDRIEVFTDAWKHLVEHITRSEVQMNHYPETRPLLYNVPIKVLDYIFAMTDRCVDILQRKGSNDFKVSFLLVPSSNRSIMATELFPSLGSELSGLVVVHVPLDFLYNARKLQQMLCHEISHFAGEYFRCREERQKWYIHAVAILIANVFFSSDNAQLVCTIEKHIRNEVMSPLSEGTPFALIEVRYEIDEWVSHVFANRYEMASIVRDGLFAGAAIGHKLLNFAEKPSCIEDFKKLHYIIYSLFREAYADLSMLFLFNVSTEDYIASFDSEFLDSNPNCNGDSYAKDFFALRIAICLKVMERESPEISSFNGVLVGRVIKQYNTNQIKLLHPEIIKCIQSYLSMCYERLKEIPNDDLCGLRRFYCGAESETTIYDAIELGTDYRRNSFFIS